MSEPTMHQIRSSVQSGECPWCTDGRVFDTPANHTAKAHGIDCRELRRLAGLSARARICSPEHTDRMQTMLSGRPESQRGKPLVPGDPRAGGRQGNHGATWWIEALHRAQARLKEAHAEEFARYLAEEREAGQRAQTEVI